MLYVCRGSVDTHLKDCYRLHAFRYMSAILGQRVLVLNRLWQAVNVCSVRRALTLLFTDHAHVVYNDDDGNFHTFSFVEWTDFSELEPDDESIATVSFRLRIPHVILLLGYDRFPKQEVKFTRHNIFERDKNTCQYCGKKHDTRDLNLDHVVPRQQDGPTSWENIVCSCVPCNSRKSNRTPEQAGMHLIRQPRKPRWHPFMQVRFSMHYHESWRHFLDMAYWNVELGEDLQ